MCFYFDGVWIWKSRKKIFIDDECTDGDLHKRVLAMGGYSTSRRACSDYIIVNDVTKPGARNELSMVLTGGCLVSYSCFTAGSSTLGNGCRLAFKSLLVQPKWAFVSPKFQADCPGLAKIIHDVIKIQAAPRRWKLLSYADMMVWVWVLKSHVFHLPHKVCIKLKTMLFFLDM